MRPLDDHHTGDWPPFSQGPSELQRMANSQALPGLRPVQEWRNLFRDPASPAYAALSAIYGADRPLLRQKAEFVLDLLDLFPTLFPADAPILLVRSVGRINLIGSHVDHR